MSRFDAWLADGREVSVAGLGLSGAAVVGLLARRGIHVYASDSAAASGPLVVPGLKTPLPRSATIEYGRHDLARIARSVALVVSPGIPPTAPVVAAARANGVTVVAEAQLGLDAMPGVPYIAVTGTNGKTTTTAMLDHVMRSGGRRSIAAGNIGTPVSAVALDASVPEWIALELSSFQLHDMPDVRPAVGVLTNLAPDHLDRYPTTAEYFADKARLFANADSGSVWVSNFDDPESRRMLCDVSGAQHRFSTARGTTADGWYDHDRRRLMIGGRALLDRDLLPLLGDHNVANALAASLALFAAGMTLDQIGSGLMTFAPLAHRMEPIRTLDAVEWINDSKATNVASTLVAVQGMAKPFVLLLGGRHKGEPYVGLAESLAAHCIAVIAYGEAQDLIIRDLAGTVPVVAAGTFADVMRQARNLAPEGGAVLLSPACSSYDMFDNYGQRGAAFRSTVEGW